MFKRITRVFLSCILVFMMIPNVVQASLDDLKDDLKENQQAQEETIKKIDKNNATIDELRDEITKLDKDIDSAEAEINRIDKEINSTQKNLDKVTEELEEAIAEKEEQKATLDERLRIMYMYSDISYLEILFSAKGFSDLITKIDMIKTIAQYDQEVFEKLEKIEEDINEKKEKIENEKAKLLTLKNDSVAKKQSLNNIKTSRESYAKALNDQISVYEKDLNALEAESNRIESEIISLQKIDDNINEGVYKWPTPGYTRITSPYGYRIHPILGYRKFHSGIDISVSGRKGISAVAVGFGEVIQSTYTSGYGNKVVIDLGVDEKGNKISAVYAHLAKRYVSVGNYLAPGDRVGEVGTTGMSTGIHLHFEIRINGSTTNPLNYVTPR
ncbi:MAG: murein hydrolase activator EnvC family protein [Eubacteriaceae bacterium]